MESRVAETAEATTEAAVDLPAAAGAPLQQALARFDARGVLALQRAIGNAAVARLIHGEDVPTHAPTGADAWTEDEIRAIQKEVKRLGLYSAGIDGDRGARTNAGLDEAFGGEFWKSMTPTEAHEKLRAAAQPGATKGGGTTLRYAELFRDGVLDVTFGVGYLEENKPKVDATETHAIVTQVTEELAKRGYAEDNDKAAELLTKAGRPLADKKTGRFFVKENHFTYTPPAGDPRSIHSIVRVISNDVAGGGGAASAAFKEGMTVGDAAFYSGHGRYGTGPDFDRNYIEFRLYDSAGKLQQTLDDYVALEHELRKEGKDPWVVFEGRLANGTLQVDLSNAGNVRLSATPNSSEFGARLIAWALDKTKATVQTGKEGQLGKDAEAGPQKYRVLAFYGCSTNSYDKALRSTPGFDTKQADVLVTNRTTRGGADLAAFMSFLDSFVNQTSAEKMLGGLNKAMREHEDHYTGDPWQFTGIKDNPGR